MLKKIIFTVTLIAPCTNDCMLASLFGPKDSAQKAAFPVGLSENTINALANIKHDIPQIIDPVEKCLKRTSITCAASCNLTIGTAGCVYSGCTCPATTCIVYNLALLTKQEETLECTRNVIFNGKSVLQNLHQMTIAQRNNAPTPPALIMNPNQAVEAEEKKNS